MDGSLAWVHWGSGRVVKTGQCMVKGLRIGEGQIMIENKPIDGLGPSDWTGLLAEKYHPLLPVQSIRAQGGISPLGSREPRSIGKSASNPSNMNFDWQYFENRGSATTVIDSTSRPGDGKFGRSAWAREEANKATPEVKTYQ
uniref:NADH dehydrogenase [ubiquinone] iron-sulfur protein 4, mitochondrial n=1 Tax=Steinernema glaseri TaxID=37863 RepID=A0A1I8A950_9BILA